MGMELALDRAETAPLRKETPRGPSGMNYIEVVSNPPPKKLTIDDFEIGELVGVRFNGSDPIHVARRVITFANKRGTLVECVCIGASNGEAYAYVTSPVLDLTGTVLYKLEVVQPLKVRII